MTDQPVFDAFLTNICGLTVPRAKTEMLSFVDTFSALLTTTDLEIDNFVKNTHAANSARAAAAKILIPTAAMLALKAVLFELKDRQKCGALPEMPMLAALDQVQVVLMRAQRTEAVTEAARTRVKLPEMTVPKLTTTNYETFHTAFQAVAACTIGHNDLPLDYLMRTANGLLEIDCWKLIAGN